MWLLFFYCLPSLSIICFAICKLLQTDKSIIPSLLIFDIITTNQPFLFQLARTFWTFAGFHWMKRQVGSFCGTVWIMSWCVVSRWPCWRGTAAGRRRRGGSVSMCWTSTTTRRSSRRTRTLARWERTNRPSRWWHESGWDVCETFMFTVTVKHHGNNCKNYVSVLNIEGNLI